MSETWILVVDDDLSARQALVNVLRREGYHLTGASSAGDALEELGKSRFDLVLSDVRMERMDGIELLQAIKQRWPSIPVIIMTAFASIETAIRSIHEGAYDYVSKPYEINELRLTVRRALEQAQLLRENLTLRQNLEEHEREPHITGMSPAMVEVYKTIARVARTDTTVLIQGESGTGKELVARAIHANSSCRDAPFLAVNCGALTETLLETELFGHVKGAFTGAAYTRKGLFEAANHGTVFLDEISEMSPNMQAKLLRVLEERVITRVGSVEPLHVHIRVIAATNRSLEQLVKDNRFREDLYYRLKVVTVTIPPLRDRIADLPLLFDHLLRKRGRKSGRTIAVHGDVLKLLSQYDWPGNVRELENVVERAVALNTSGILTPVDFAEGFSPREEGPFLFSDTRLSLEEIEQHYVTFVLKRCSGNVTRAAEKLKIDRRTLYRILERSEKAQSTSESSEPDLESTVS